MRAYSAILLLCLVAGCATPPKPQVPVFFPAPPAEARLQFLTSYSSAEDLAPQNRFLRFLIGSPPARPPIAKPYGMAMAQGRIYVCDTFLGRVHVLDLKAKRFGDFVFGRGCNIQKPVNLAVDDDGTLYVADTLLGQVVICSGKGTFLGTIGEKGVSRLTDVAIEGDRLYIANMLKGRVDVYDKTSRKPLGAIPADSTNGVGRLQKPTNIAVDGRKNVYVSDAALFCVQKYDPEGRYLRTFGRLGDAPGEFARPKGVALDRDGRLYVVDAASSVVQVFDTEGKLLLYFGEEGSGRGQLFLPATVIVDYDHVGMFRDTIAPDFKVEYLVLVASQYGFQKVNVYGFGRPAPIPGGRPGSTAVQ